MSRGARAPAACSSAPHHRDRQVSPLGIGGEMRFVEDVASVAGLVPTGATKFCVSLAAAAFRIFAASQRDGAYKSLELYLARKINVL